MELYLDKTTNQKVAVKFIERGDKVITTRNELLQHSFKCNLRCLRIRVCLLASSFSSSWSFFLLERTLETLPGKFLIMPHHFVHLNMQITKYVEREIINHRHLMHPHIVQFKEVKSFSTSNSLLSLLDPSLLHHVDGYPTLSCGTLGCRSF